MQIPSSFIDELLQKTDIVSVISRYVQLNQKGKTFWGLCPFHGEKTASFAVNVADQFYHCFGCKESGNAISFVMKMESCTFVDAVKILAEWAGLKVPESVSNTDEAESKKKKQCISALRDCAIYYHECLNSNKGKDAKAYLEKRGVSDNIARLFGLGYCPDYDSTKTILNKKGYSDDILLEAGILKKGEHGLYDPMGQRVVFPVINIYSEVLAFTGRTMKKEVDFAKYLNTAETIVYSKGKNLYALNLVKKYQKQGKKFDFFILCEGNMDVVSLHKAGFGMAVAGMGTALTFDQAKLIKRFVNKVYICYDGDTAGKKATLRGLDILKDQGLDVLVMRLPDGKDPDDIIKYEGREAFQKLIDEALPLVEYKIKSLLQDYDTSSFDGKTKFTTAAINVLNDLKSDVEKETYLALVQEISGVNRDFLRRQMTQQKNGVSTTTLPEKSDEKPVEQSNSLSKAEKTILKIAYHKNISQELNKAKEDISYFSNLMSKSANDVLCDIQTKKSANEIFDKHQNISQDVGEIVVGEIEENNYIKEFWDCIKSLQNDYLLRRQEELNKEIAAEAEKEKRQKLLIELNSITKELKSNK